MNKFDDIVDAESTEPAPLSVAVRVRKGLETLRAPFRRATAGDVVSPPPGLALLSLLGALCGLLSGVVILALHLAIDWLQVNARGDLLATGYAGLPAILRFAVPLGGAVLLGLIYQWSHQRFREGGIVHITERLSYHQGQLPFRNALLQFVGAAISVASGQSVGREGAAAHMGAATSSLLGQRLELPNNTLRTLVGCGTAAGIAASFNTPLAGVIFAMEVVMMEYSIVGFAPIILAAVSATAVTHLIDTGHPELIAASVELNSLTELPWLIASGVIIGCFSALFVNGTANLTERLKTLPIVVRFSIAGAVTGGLAVLFPQITDIGFDSLNGALAGQFGFGLVIGIASAKLLATSIATAAALPGGVILPSLLMGATLGGALGMVGSMAAPTLASPPAFYALLGMGAMMGAVLQAPLTALIVILELSGSTEIVFPAMLIVVTALLVSREGFKTEGVFSMLLRQRGLDYRNDPISQSLRRMSVITSMDRQVSIPEPVISVDEAREILARKPNWLVLSGEQARASVLPTAELARHLSELDAAAAAAEEPRALPAQIRLLEIPAQRMEAAPVNLRATLQEALDTLESSGADCLYVTRRTRHDQRTIYGILTPEAIQNTYLH